MLVISGKEIDSPLREHLRSSNPDATQIQFFLYFLQEYKLFIRSLEASRETLSMNTEKAARQILVLPIKPKKLNCALS